MSERDAFGLRDRPHVSLDSLRTSGKFKPKPQPQKRDPLRANYPAHAAGLIIQFRAALPPMAPVGSAGLVFGLKAGTVVEVHTLAPLGNARKKATKIPPGIEFPNQDIVVLRSNRGSDRSESAIVFIPDEARGHLHRSIAAYGNDPGDAPRFETIETVRPASARSLVVGQVSYSDPMPLWWELWVRGTSQLVRSVEAAARNSELLVHPQHLSFPDTTVLFVHAPAGSIIGFADRVLGAIAEIRPARGTIDLFLEITDTDVNQHDWVADLAQRVVPPCDGAPSVCVMDTGVSGGHLLLAPGLRGAWAYDDAWGSDDHRPHGGHGTGMAGLALYGDLEPHMHGSAAVQLTHAVESIKMLPPLGFPPTEPPAYGIVTQGAVARVESEQPNRGRSFCIASSANDFPPGQPSTWSGALDQIASGAMVGDTDDDAMACDLPKRLIVVAAGNAVGGMQQELADCQDLEDPAQSWNALTIGGITHKEILAVGQTNLKALVPANHRSPYSRGSQGLPDDLTPIKPEVLFEAGNMTVDPGGFCSQDDALSLLALGADHGRQPLIPFWATSAAAGVAANFIGQLHAAHPDLWPETHRALTVDSARWPAPIAKRLVGRGAHWRSKMNKRARQALLREVGYGVPDIERAVMSARNDVTLVAQAEIQPFLMTQGSGAATFNELHFYKLPWPREVLEAMGDAIVAMKVTLSYFIEPNLTGRAGTRPDTYRSFGLRFAMRKRGQSEAAFRAGISVVQGAEKADNIPEASRWLLGPKSIQAGSLHCDLWRGRAVELAGHDMLAIFPVGGWWKSHSGLKRANDKARYALVISISAPGQAVDLHATISNLVVGVQVEV